jgi:hypothetical protein
MVGPRHHVIGRREPRRVISTDLIDHRAGERKERVVVAPESDRATTAPTVRTAENLAKRAALQLTDSKWPVDPAIGARCYARARPHCAIPRRRDFTR